MGDKTVGRVVAYASSIRYGDLPPEVVHQVKRLVIDAMGCGIGAFDCVPCKIVRNFASNYKSTRSATLLGTKVITTPDLAGFSNGIMTRYLDFNDNYAGKSNAHPSDNIPILMAVAEAHGTSGKDLITGIILSYEIQSAWADTYRLKDGGPWDQAAYMAISAPLGAGKLMGLTSEQLAEAVHISVVQGLPFGEARRGILSHWKACAVPNAGRNGIISALLAQQGLTGPPAIFEGSAGFFVGATNGPVILEPLAGEDGNEHPFRIMKSSIKRFPTGYPSQTVIEAALDAREVLKLNNYQNTQRVVVKTCEQGFKAMGESRTRWRPKTRETADHSIPYVVACALCFGSVDVGHFEESLLENPELHELMDKIEVQLDPVCEAEWPDAILCKVTIETKDGRCHTSEVRYHLGHFKRPMSDEDLESKFRRLTQGYFDSCQQERTLSAIWKLEKLEDIREILKGLVVSEKSLKNIYFRD